MLLCAVSDVVVVRGCSYSCQCISVSVPHLIRSLIQDTYKNIKIYRYKWLKIHIYRERDIKGHAIGCSEYEIHQN